MHTHTSTHTHRHTHTQTHTHTHSYSRPSYVIHFNRPPERANDLPLLLSLPHAYAVSSPTQHARRRQRSHHKTLHVRGWALFGGWCALNGINRYSSHAAWSACLLSVLTVGARAGRTPARRGCEGTLTVSQLFPRTDWCRRDFDNPLFRPPRVKS